MRKKHVNIRLDQSITFPYQFYALFIGIPGRVEMLHRCIWTEQGTESQIQSHQVSERT